MLLSWSDNLKVVCDEHVIADPFICQVIDKCQGRKGPKHRDQRHANLSVILPLKGAAQFHFKSSFRWRLYPPEKDRSPLCYLLKR